MNIISECSKISYDKVIKLNENMDKVNNFLLGISEIAEQTVKEINLSFNDIHYEFNNIDKHLLEQLDKI